MNAVGMFNLHVLPMNELQKSSKIKKLANDSLDFQAQIEKSLLKYPFSEGSQAETEDIVNALVPDVLEAHDLISNHFVPLESESLELHLSDQKMDPAVLMENMQILLKMLDAFISDETITQKQYNQLLSQVDSILVPFSSEQAINKIAPKMKMLNKWSVLEGKRHNSSDLPHSLLTSNDPKTKENSIWRELLSSYQKQTLATPKKQSNLDSKITSKDIARWLNSGFNTIQLGTQHHLTAMPMPKLEQYVIYIHSTQGSTSSADQQLIEQFKSVMKTSRFLMMNNGANQLSIALSPENMGEIMVKLTQVNGEMTLKIIVTSHVTRQMLETNIHELRNMFSPQQVVIEEQELDIQTSEREDEEQPLQDQGQDHPHQSDKDDSQASKSDAKLPFHELLVNQKG